MPSEATWICGTKACVLPGDWSIRITGLQVSPPSVDCEKAILEAPVGLKRASCQTA